MKWKCICSYKGTFFKGWQSQPSKLGVQDHIEHALSSIFNTRIRIIGCSRTDAGVHAKGQCFHFEANWSHTDEKLLRAMHSKLDREIKIESIKKAPHSFHARFSAKLKQYTYTIYLGRPCPLEKDFVWECRNNNLDYEEMIKASQILIGEHNFTAFSAVNSKDKDPNPFKKIQSIKIRKKDKKILITIKGSGFLYKMVRSISGTLYAIGRKKLSTNDLKNILKAKKRSNIISTAPAEGLCLDKIFY